MWRDKVKWLVHLRNQENTVPTVSCSNFSKNNIKCQQKIQNMLSQTTLYWHSVYHTFKLHSIIQSSFSFGKKCSPSILRMVWPTTRRTWRLGKWLRPTIRGYEPKNISRVMHDRPSWRRRLYIMPLLAHWKQTNTLSVIMLGMSKSKQSFIHIPLSAFQRRVLQRNKLQHTKQFISSFCSNLLLWIKYSCSILMTVLFTLIYEITQH